jgi:O-antigen/teichoic acid export membrane protein
MTDPQPSLRRRLATGGAWVALGKGVGSATALGTHALLARTLPPEQISAYFLLLSLVMGAFAVSHLALGQAAVRLIAGAIATDLPGRARAAVAQLAWAVIFVGALATLALSFGGGWLGELVDLTAIAPVAPLAGLWLLVQCCQALLGELWRGLHDILRATVFGGMLGNVLALTGLAVWSLVGLELDLARAIAILTAAPFVSLIIGASLLRPRVAALAGPGRLTIAETGRSVLPLLLVALPWLVIEQAHVVLLGALGFPLEVAIYGAAVRLMAFVTMPLLIINGVLGPMIASLHARGDSAGLQRLLQGTAAAVGVPSAFGLLVVGVFAGDLLTLIYGPDFVAGAVPLAVLCLAQLVNVLAGSCGLTLVLTGHNKAMLVIVGSAATANLVLGLVLIPALGMLGGALAFGLTLVGMNVGLVLGTRRLAGVWTYASITPALGLLTRRSPA